MQVVPATNLLNALTALQSLQPLQNEYISGMGLMPEEFDSSIEDSGQQLLNTDTDGVNSFKVIFYSITTIDL